MKNKLTKIFILALVAILLFGTVTASAFESYDTFTYSIDGEPLLSPAAYTPDVSTYDAAAMGLHTLYGANDQRSKLGEVADIVTDSKGNFYIVDYNASAKGDDAKANGRIIILDKDDYKVIDVIDHYYDQNGDKQTFSSPSGVYVTNPKKMVDGEERIYICDTANKRIVVLDSNHDHIQTITVPKDNTEDPTALLTENEFAPTAIAVDIYGRIFVASAASKSGIIVMSSKGDFTGYIGAQKVAINPIDLIWQKFQSVEQIESGYRELPSPYNNVTVDDLGFVYATIRFEDKESLSKQLAGIKTKEASYSPIKKLNSVGKEILKRNGFFDPGGEVDILDAVEVSEIIDVALGPENTWSILDRSRSRIFTYDSNGNLLFAFGDKGEQLGNGENYTAMTYQCLYDEELGRNVYNLVLLDKTANPKLVVFQPTEYCDMIMNALRNENNHQYSQSIEYWQDVLTLNNNFDLAYIGIGKALFNIASNTTDEATRRDLYNQAMEMLKSAYETEYYSTAFASLRKDILSKWMLPMIIGIIALLLLFFKFLGWAKKKNKATSLKPGRKTYLEELLYVFHLVFHPFDGFWDLKHEKRGSVRAATTILGVAILSFFYQSVGQGYVFNPKGDYSSVIMQVLGLLVPVLLWVISNWCLTTLFDGEGSLKDIYIATCYSLAPLPLFVTISTILTNVFTVSEAGIVNLLVSIGWVWVVILLFFGMVVTHDYSTGKNVITTLGTIVAMCVIMFIIILFSSLVLKMVTFVMAIITEIGNLV